jgi:hypothetical protein
MKIYVASSWRCDYQPVVVEFLRKLGHLVYDFKNPREGDNGFHWTEIDPNWKNWTPGQFVLGLKTPLAESGFKSDMDALEWCDACVLVLPCNRSAHLELGWAVGAGKKTVVLLNDPFEPELMYKMVDHVVGTLEDLEKVLGPVT